VLARESVLRSSIVVQSTFIACEQARTGELITCTINY